jgi:hypothetical protein
MDCTGLGSLTAVLAPSPHKAPPRSDERQPGAPEPELRAERRSRGCAPGGLLPGVAKISLSRESLRAMRAAGSRAPIRDCAGAMYVDWPPRQGAWVSPAPAGEALL